MRFDRGLMRFQNISRVALATMIGGLASACSSDSSRFADASFSNPFSARSEPAETGTLAEAAPTPLTSSAPMPRQSVQSQPLAAPAYPAAAARPIQAPRQIAAAPAPTQTGAGGWSASGGSAVLVRDGENLASLSNLYGVPPQAILRANGLSSGAQIQPGQRLTIPVYSATGGDSGSAAPVRTAQPAAKPTTNFKLVEGAKPAAAPKAAQPVRIAEPAAKPAAPSKPVAEPKVAKIEAPKPAKAEPVKTAKAEEPKAKPEKIAAAPVPQAEPAKPAKEPESTGALQSAEFRWPARGRVISGFGGSGGNEGINISVPDGTPVKAAESGTVAYAGSEVKGYGNLVLIRHENGFVSAYAHNGELSVKRGDKVKRGQVVAKSGQSGNVTSPQLHFEIRKGSTPVDPTPYLAGNS